MKLSVFIFFLFGLGLASFPAFAHGDEIATDPGVAKDHFTVYGQSDRYELTLYYPELNAGQEAHLTLYVADFKTNRPIDKAELKITTAENAQIVFEVKQLSAGVYELHVTFPENKIYTLNVQISHPNGADLIGIAGLEVGKKLSDVAGTPAEPSAPNNEWLWFIGGICLGGLGVWFVSRRRSRTLTVLLLLASAWFSTPNFNPVFAHGDEEHGPQSGGSGYGKSVYAPKETQFLFEILTQPIAIGDYQSATTMYGTIIPSSGGLGAVMAPQSGRVTRVNVAVGQTVRAGQVLAVLQQNIGTAEQVGIATNNAGLAVQIESARTRVTATKRELDRLKKIEDIAAAKDVQAAEGNYNQALTELQTLESRAMGANSAANSRTITLTSPISGVMGAFTLTPGTEVSAGQTLFTITNLNKVYVEAQVYNRDLSVIRAGNKFLVTCSTDDHKTAEVRLISPAQTMNPGNQSQRVLFEMDNPKGEFKIGEFVTVKALNQQISRNISVPNSALTEINGKPAVFLKDDPEIFTLSYVQTGEDDGTRTLILKGVEEGGKVVANGAYEVKMMYLNQ
ncbi:MAG TPA: efflux RND transporter periplasmic adaptor subunit [Saprospiraceae bacterium]|nr:efflux RND transporter periplasmic adaptor subunit [Saprospiraceae bacterium]HPI04803.1 efflux RND transporter periplasmic adaptor subunit [Saprospiraceae bacterium]